MWSLNPRDHKSKNSPKYIKLYYFCSCLQNTTTSPFSQNSSKLETLIFLSAQLSQNWYREASNLKPSSIYIRSCSTKATDLTCISSHNPLENLSMQVSNLSHYNSNSNLPKFGVSPIWLRFPYAHNLPSYTTRNLHKSRALFFCLSIPHHLPIVRTSPSPKLTPNPSPATLSRGIKADLHMNQTRNHIRVQVIPNLT